jgi:hypothetical protein
MSKVDAQRAMKAARHARTPAAAPPPTRRAAAPEQSAAPPAGTTTVHAPAAGTPAAATPAPAGLCGHRSMAGKECRRPAGHAEKSHRYG